MMSKDFDDILNICLDRITRDGDTIEHCLETYPEHAAELTPLLRAAHHVKKASSAEPRPEFQQAAKARFMSALAAKQQSSHDNKKKRSLQVWNWQQRWATVAAAIIAILLIGGGTVTASANSLPGDMLYSVKIATENVREFFTFSDEAKANLYIELAERRVTEVELLIESERVVTESVLNEMHTETERAIDHVEQNEVPDESPFTSDGHPCRPGGLDPLPRLRLLWR